MSFVTYPNLGRCGRLGNQMHQIASTIGIARSTGADPLFPPDWIYRHVFSLPDEMFGTESGPWSSELALGLDPSERPYLQHLSLWADVADEVYSVFKPSEYAEEAIATVEKFWDLENPVLSVHVRRGDNVQANDPGTPNKHLYHPLRPLSYFEAAIDSIRSEVKSVAIFGDDVAWNLNNLKGDFFMVPSVMPKEHLSEYLSTVPMDWIDLLLMARCERHILSNSTFGGWAALLSHDPDVIYPENWYGPAISADAHAMFPSTWHEFPCPLEAPTC